MGIRLLVADDQEIVRAGLKALLPAAGIEIVGEATSGGDALKLAETLRPDVVLLDIRIPGNDALATLAKLRTRFPTLPVVMLSAYDNPTYVARAMALGASGYLLKGAPRQDFVVQIETAAKGGSNWTRQDLRRLTGALATPRIDAEIDVPLTNRESEVLVRLANGLTNREIAKDLSISYETVKEHVQHIFKKLGVSDRTQAAVWAVRKNLL